VAVAVQGRSEVAGTVTNVGAAGGSASTNNYTGATISYSGGGGGGGNTTGGTAGTNAGNGGGNAAGSNATVNRGGGGGGGGEWKQRRERGVGRSSYPIPHSRRNRFNHYYNGITDYRHRRFIHLLPIHSHRNIGDRIMAHFAKIQNDVVVEVLTINNDDCGGGDIS
jgi:hypothetical protein